MKHKNSHLLVGYWSRLRAGREIPDQIDIDPRAIKRLLSYTFILDCENPARPIYRLAGTALCERFGTTREAMQTGLTEIKDVPSVIYGKVTFNPETRRVQGANYRLLVVKDGKFAVSDGIHA